MSLHHTPLSGKVAIVTGSAAASASPMPRNSPGRAHPSSSTTSTRRPPPTRSRASRPRAARPSRSSPRSGPPRRRRRSSPRPSTNFGRLDILVTNAGVLRDTVLWKMSDDDFDTVINVHLRGTFTCVREAVDLHARERDRRAHHLHRLADRAARQLRPDQLRRRQGRHRRHGAHVGARAQARGHHRERGHPGRRHRDDRDGALLRGRRRGRREGRADAGLLPPRPRLRHVGRRRRAHRLSRLGCRGRRHRPGHRRRRRPHPGVVAPRARGRRVPRRRLDATTRSPRLRRRVRRPAAERWARSSRRCRKTCSARPA